MREGTLSVDGQLSAGIGIADAFFRGGEVSEGQLSAGIGPTEGGRGGAAAASKAVEEEMPMQVQ